MGGFFYYVKVIVWYMISNGIVNNLFLLKIDIYNGSWYVK